MIQIRLFYQWTVFGGYIKETPTEDWCVGESVTLNNDGGISLEFNAKIYGSFKVLAEEAAEDIYYDNYEDSVYTGFHIDPNSDDYAYSRAEIAKMITEKESEIKSLNWKKSLRNWLSKQPKHKRKRKHNKYNGRSCFVCRRS